MDRREKILIGICVFILLCVIGFVVANAADCPTPKPLTCEQLKTKMDQRCPTEPKATPCPPQHECQPCVVCQPCPTPLPPKEIVIRERYEVLVPEAPKGHWLAGAGPVYFHGVGLTAGGGYEWKNGWMIFGGPMYVPQNDIPPYYGEVKPKKGCPVPFVAPGNEAPHPWGGQVLVIKAF